VSFDLFDTLLNRKKHSEIARFKKVSYKFASETRRNKKEVFRSRVSAWRAAYKQKLITGTEASWSLIAGIMEKDLKLSAKEVYLLGKIEIEYEKNWLKPNKKNLTRLKTLHSKNLPIIIVSDMYLELEQIEELLIHFDISQYITKIYVSSTNNFSKVDGSAFKKICSNLEIKPEELLHFGDNHSSDYTIPKQLAIDAVHTPRKIRAKYEKCSAKIWIIAYEWNLYV
jgi:HAD superfamily hydrolase (TIGR01549 family)